MDTTSVIIVGGGIGGMTAALALAQKNIPSVVLEQAPYFRETGAGILLCPNVFKMFDHLNVMPEMVEIAGFPEYLIYADGVTGFEYLRIPMGQDIVKRFNYPYGSFHREELLRALIQACKRSSLIQLVTSAKVIKVEEKEAHVFAELEGGKIYQGEALIACDGLWSNLRDQIIEKDSLRFSGHVTYRGVISQKDVSSHLIKNHVVHWDLPNAHLVQYPIGKKDLFNIVAVYHTDKDEEGKKEVLFERFSHAQPEIVELLHKVNTSKYWKLYDREPVANWSRGRMTLLGDSAHPTLPHLTQGAGMAIEDALVLAKKVEEANGDYPAAFEAYQKERYLRTAHVQIFSRAYGDIHHTDGIPRELRNFLISKRTQQENYNWLAPIYQGIEI